MHSPVQHFEAIDMATLTDRAFGQDFEMKDFIAQGTFAKVFRCVERKTGRDFAVKAFQNEDENFDPKLIDNEVDIWRTLQHRNIVSLYKRFYENSHVWVVLELVSGKTLLDQIINQIVFSEEESRTITLQVRNSRIRYSAYSSLILNFRPFFHRNSKYPTFLLASFFFFDLKA